MIRNPGPYKAAVKHALARYCIEGDYFQNVHAILNVAQEKGFVGSYHELYRRLKSGLNRWEWLCAPVDVKNVQRSLHAQVTARAKRLAAKQSMAELIAQMDARKTAASLMAPPSDPE